MIGHNYTKILKIYIKNGHEKGNRKCSPYVEQRLGFMHLYITDGTVFAGFQVAYNAHLANCKP